MPPVKLTSVRILRPQLLARRTTLNSRSTDRIAKIAASARILNSHPETLPLPQSTSPSFQDSKYLPISKLVPSATPNPFDNLQNELSRHLATHPASMLSPTLPKLFTLLREYESNPQHWSRYAHANASKHYTRNLVCEVPGLFNLLILVWTPGKQSPVHDHADSHCLMKILKGKLTETRFAIPCNPGLDGPLLRTSRKNFNRDQVTYMSDSLGLHEISNPSPTDLAVSMHLYTPPNAALRGCHIYDQYNGEAKHVMQGAYDSINGVVS